MNHMIHDGRVVKSFPERKKDDAIIENGYEPEDFGGNYWVARNIKGNRRIDRDARSLIAYVEGLVGNDVLPAQPKVCDVSCGPGNMVMDFRNHGFDAVGCEFSKAARDLGKEHFNMDIPFGDLRGQLPFLTDSFDFAYCVGVMTMIPKKDVPNACQELHRIINSGGLLHILLINPGMHGPRAGNEPHLTRMPHSEWNQHFLDAGLTDITADWRPQNFGIGVNPDPDFEFAKLYRKP